MTVLDLSSQIIIGGTDYTAYFRSSERVASLEMPGVTLSVVFKPSFPWTSVLPWADLVFYEAGTKVFTGYVSHIVPSRSPAQVEVTGMDTFKRCREYFLPEQVTTSGSASGTLGYYVGLLCDTCGISYSINDATGSAIVLVNDVPLGLRFVSDALVTLCAVGQWCMRVDPDGVLQFDHIPHPTAPDYDLGEPVSFEQDRNDTDTRNQAKIWGFDTSGSSGGGSILYQESRAVTGVTDTRAMVFAEPHVDSLAKAQQLATAVLDQWAALDNTISANIVGNANLRVGQAVEIRDGWIVTSGSYMDTLTDLKSRIGLAGYQMDLTAGRRAYRYPYWPVGIGTPPIGVIVCTDGNLLWTYGDGVVGGPSDDEKDTYTHRCTSISATSDAVFAVGFDGLFSGPILYSPYVLIKRLAADDGHLVWGITHTISTIFLKALCATDESDLFVVFSYQPSGINTLRIEKRSQADGSLIWELDVPDTDTDYMQPDKIVMDTNGLYLSGIKGGDWCVQKRSRVTGVIVWNETPPSDPSYIGVGDATSLCVQTGSIYATGYVQQSGSPFRFMVRYEKRDAITGAMAWGVTDPALSSGGDNFGYSIAHDGTNLYVLLKDGFAKLRTLDPSSGATLVTGSGIGSMRNTVLQDLVANQYGVFPFFEQAGVDGDIWHVHVHKIDSSLNLVWSNQFDTYKSDDVQQSVSIYGNQIYIGYPDNTQGFCVRKICGFTFA